MKKLKIFLYHLFVFILGAVGLGIYFAYKISALPERDGLVGMALLPIAVVYIVGFGILCLISLASWLIIAYFKGPAK